MMRRPKGDSKRPSSINLVLQSAVATSILSLEHTNPAQYPDICRVLRQSAFSSLFEFNLHRCFDYELLILETT
jgi:hypothetical protein